MLFCLQSSHFKDQRLLVELGTSLEMVNCMFWLPPPSSSRNRHQKWNSMNMEIRARFDFNFGRNVSNLVVQFVSSMSRVAALPRVCLLLRLLRTELAVLGRPSASLPWRLVESSQQLAAVTVAGIWSKLSKQPARLPQCPSLGFIDR